MSLLPYRRISYAYPSYNSSHGPPWYLLRKQLVDHDGGDLAYERRVFY
jgi:hypothetical protein